MRAWRIPAIDDAVRRDFSYALTVVGHWFVSLLHLFFIDQSSLLLSGILATHTLNQARAHTKEQARN
jgi:hypothetical protein